MVVEVDAGRHQSVMKQMWRMTMERAWVLDLQVLATIHGRNCHEVLAEVLQTHSSSASVTVQRIDAARQQSMAFRNDETVEAADRGIVVRSSGLAQVVA